MDPLVQVTCDRCGNITAPTRTVIVFPVTGEFRVSCPLCCEMIVRMLSDELVAILVAGGAQVRKVLPPMTVDDLIDFHERFDEEIEELLA